jgi:hypothetical protein
MKYLKILCTFLFISNTIWAQESIPYLSKKGTATQLMVDDKPFLMIAGELHNSSASTVEYMEPLFPKLKAMHLNSVFVTVAWEQFEPEEGVYDYKLIDAILKNAKENDLRVALLWFATWKNGESSYTPLWVKKDTKRFWRVKTKDGQEIETMSPFCEATKEADAKAFTALMTYLKKVDKDRTVILMQPQNEVGLFQDIDYNKSSLKAFEGDVPQKLITYLNENKNRLDSYLRDAWAKQNYKTSGTWKEVFGDTPKAKTFFTTWEYATYINYIAAKGREAYDLPMMVNAWIVQEPGDLPGVYPNGGPVSRVIDIWKAAAPAIDIQSPDIYLPNFKDIVAMYHREDNPLLVPESTSEVGRAYYAFGQHDAICYSPFGIEDAYNDFLFKKSYAVLNEIEHLILKYQGTGNMKAVLQESGDTYQDYYMGDYKVKVMYEKPDEPSFGIIIQTDDGEFMVIGMNLTVYFTSEVKSKTGYIGQVFEGRFEGEQFVPTRMMNGDETFHNSRLRVFGRQFTSTEKLDEVQKKQGDPDAYSPATQKTITTPGVYKVIVYQR